MSKSHLDSLFRSVKSTQKDFKVTHEGIIFIYREPIRPYEPFQNLDLYPGLVEKFENFCGVTENLGCHYNYYIVIYVFFHALSTAIAHNCMVIED